LKYFVEGNGLSSLPTEKKLGLTMFLALITLGYITGVLMGLRQWGMSPRRISTYYLGDETQLIFPKNYGALLENTHFHLFSMAIIYLALTHLFLICSVGYRFKVWLISLTFAGLLLEVGAPWIIRYVGAGWGWLMTVSGPLLSVASFLMVALIIRELWFRNPPYKNLEQG
jgi:hypothetical protein